MDKKEVITLSSDEECDFIRGLENSPTKSVSQNLSGMIKANLEKLTKRNLKNNTIIQLNKNVDVVKLSKVPKKKPVLSSKESPEVVDLEDYSEKLPEEGEVQCVNNKSVNIIQNPYSQEIIDVDEIPNDSQPDNEDNKEKYDTVNHNADSLINNVENNNEKLIQNANSNSLKDTKILESHNETLKATESSDQNLKFFTEFVDYCGCLEEIPNDRAKLTKKLMKKYGEANCHYIKSQEFRDLIQKCRLKVNKNNLYLIAKEVTDELIFRKKFGTESGKKNTSEEKCQNQEPVAEKNEIVKNGDQQSKKRTKLINKIIKKLNKLGSKIRELEEKEVDLSDEEESSYVQLQRYRERFCQIYTKLCKYTNDVADAERLCKRKICFSESKYPAISRCIENWLNKTKRFPDFSDILKLLESQSSTLGLTSNKESIRAIAIEIFQQVGAMLQRQRKYDLWNSYCEFLDGAEDPAEKDPLLDKILKTNFETRVKKEQEIFQYYVELQERNRLEPEEVPDEEASRSPVDSGNEEEKEIELIENSMNQRLDDKIKKDTEEDDNNPDANDSDENSKLKSEQSPSKTEKISFKESKNNYKNCKSLKWRLENGKRDNENSNMEIEKEEEEKIETEIDLRENECRKLDKSNQDKNHSEISLQPEGRTENHSKIITETVGCFDSPSKRKRLSENEDTIPKKKKCPTNKDVNEYSDIFQIAKNPGRKANEVFEVHCCQIFTDTAFEDFDREKKDWGKRKVFRDLTNVNRLMELHGRKRKMSGLFSPSFFHRSFCEFEKPSWKKRFKVSFRLVGSKGQKYALHQEDKSGKTINSDSGGDSEKDIQNNSEGGEDDGSNYFSSRGNGSEEDNNGDENKKNGKTDGEISENQHEDDDDDDDEEENENEEDGKIESETTKHSFPTEKTEEPTGTNSRTDNPEEGVESTTPTETITFETENEEKRESDKILKKPETPEQENDALSEKDKCETNKSEEKPKCDKEGESEANDVVELEGNSEIETEDCVIENEEVKNKITENEETKDNASGKDVPSEAIKVEKSKPKTSKEKITNNGVNKLQKPKNQTESQSSIQKTEIDIKTVKRSNIRNPLIKSKPNPMNENVKNERKKRPAAFETKPTPTRNSLRVEPPGPKPARKTTPSTSDEEIVKRFLLHSPSSISITPPKKLTLSKPPSQAAIQALATLRNLKGISTTIVRGGSKPKTEDDVVVLGGSYQKQAEQKISEPNKRRRTELPVISSVQSIDSTTPKIVTVQGNVKFENPWPGVSNNVNSQCNSNSIRISNVWGNLPNNFIPQEVITPGCSFQNNSPTRSNPVKKKTGKKTVEYVVLD